MYFRAFIAAALVLSAQAIASPALGDRDIPQVNDVCSEMPNCKLVCLDSRRDKEVREIVANDAHVIFDTLLFIAQAQSPTNTINPGTNVTMAYNTAKTFFLNEGSLPAEYCRLDWASKLQQMQSTCGSHGAKCTGSSGTWVLQFEHS